MAQKEKKWLLRPMVVRPPITTCGPSTEPAPMRYAGTDYAEGTYLDVIGDFGRWIDDCGRMRARHYFFSVPLR